MAPDALVYTGFFNYRSVYDYTFKFQREFIIQAIIIIIVLLALAAALPYIKRHSRFIARHTVLFLTTVLLIFGIKMYRHIPIESAGYAADIGAFRQSMNKGESVCVPLPPTQLYLPHASWVYGHNTPLCHGRNFELKPNFNDFSIPLKNSSTITIPNDTPFAIKTLTIAVQNKRNDNFGTIYLQDIVTGQTIMTKVPTDKHHPVRLINFNLAGFPRHDNYHFKITSNEDIAWGKFTTNEKPLYWPYFAAEMPRYNR